MHDGVAKRWWNNLEALHSALASPQGCGALATTR
jgi:hypothetical protein